VAQQPLFEQEPFDRITLDKKNNSEVLKVLPLKLPGRRLPEKPRPGSKLIVRLWDQPEKSYEVQWSSIAKVELFEQLVLQKANELTQAAKFDEAYDYFAFLREDFPKLPGLEAAIDGYLHKQAEAQRSQGKHDAALATSRELHRRNPKYPGLDDLLGSTTDKLVEEHLAKGDYRAARVLIGNLAARFPKQAVVSKWQTRLQKEAATEFAKARSALGSGKFRQAHQSIRRAVRIWPALPGAKDLFQSIHQKYSRVVVGVSDMAPGVGPDRLGNWARRRSSRLLGRMLMEFAAPGSEGGTYYCPVGSAQIEELGRRLVFQVTPDIPWSSGDATVTGLDVSRRLLAVANPQEGCYRADWAELLDSVAVENVYRVEAHLLRPHVLPGALLQTVLVPYGSPGESPDPRQSIGPYTGDSRSKNEVLYLANKGYFAAGPNQPDEIVERHFQKGADAIRALQSRRVDVLDRVAPWSLDRLRSADDLIVTAYAMPLVHCLVPNMRKPLMARRRFRRALVYGINREAILRHLLSGREVSGCRVISGPFPARRSHDDPLAYAYDDSIKPRGYDPRLAIGLAAVAAEAVAAEKDKRSTEPMAAVNLVLAHPPHEIARVACAALRRQLRPVGIQISLRELAADADEMMPEDVDLLYAELAIWEPVVDARRLLGSEGPAGGASPYMRLALRQLQQATDWPQVGEKLRHIHRIAHDEVSVVPLWQLTDHFAYHRALTGLGTRPVSLYQNIEKWHLGFHYPTEGP